MKISLILDHIDNGLMALPEFQRGYVWGREQVRSLFSSLYKRHPIGGLLVWATEAKTAKHRGDQELAAGVVKLLLDGQQRMTSLYGVARGKPPVFFDGNAQAFTGLMFHLEDEVFEFYQPVKMKDDPLWIDVSKLLVGGQSGHEKLIETLAEIPEIGIKAVKYSGRISRLLGILDINLHAEEVSGEGMTLEVVVDIFNKVNSGGTKLSKGDLALAKVCADWPEARNEMKQRLASWAAHDYDFNLDWLLRSVNTVSTGEAKFSFLDDLEPDQIQLALRKATKHIDTCLNLIAGRLGLDHARVLFGRFAVPVMVRYLEIKGGALDEVDRDKMLFWFAQAGMWGRYSGSTETFIDKDLECLEGPDGGLDKLIDELRLWHGGLRIEPGHFRGWSLGARFYPVLYMLTRMGEARDFGTGIPLKKNMLGKMSALEVHHIFPRAQLYKRNYDRPTVNAIANFCLLTKDTNLSISDCLPEVYFGEVESKHPGALSSQWVPMDETLWKVENYRDFLEARRELLAAEANARLATLLHGDTRWLAENTRHEVASTGQIVGGVASEAEEQALEEINAWVKDLGLKAGEMSFELSNPSTNEVLGMLDVVWPNGLQEGLTGPVALLLDEGEATLSLASAAGYRCFTSVKDLKAHIQIELLGNDEMSAA
ncbi:DUF262 domain-containing protein [Paracoccus litorisediminis]|uniref:GmrSD restriction endonuclease domain-containing protein n=1 Tax=Paracoccus litorisediminis TaxID=2006130 RepID=UPI00372E5D95